MSEKLKILVGKANSGDKKAFGVGCFANKGHGL